MSKDTFHDDAARLRSARAASDAAASRDPGTATRGAPCLVGKTKTVTTYPTTAATFYAVAPTDITGTEAEGSAGTYTAATSTVLALNLGIAIPASGTYVICTFVDNRWVFRYDN